MGLRLTVVTDSANSLASSAWKMGSPDFYPLGFEIEDFTSLITGFYAKGSRCGHDERVVWQWGITNLPQTLGSFFSHTAFRSRAFLVFTLLYTHVALRQFDGDSALQAAGIVIMQCKIAWLVAFGVYRIGSAIGVQEKR